ncbi:MAG TPA: MotA/TolQ/ExbB proton channel family protein [Luteolibacter sp.]|nr:MotA/TolQ/ExbB proton channel family protein [Luteolibacter sp.]
MRFQTSLRSRSAALPSLLLLAISSAAAFAQDAAPAAAGKKSLLQSWVIDGGPTMIFIGAAIVAFIALAVYNFMALTKAKFCPIELKAALMDHMMHCRVRTAIELAASHPSFLGRMVAYSFPNIDATQPETLGRDQVEDAMADFTTNEARKVMTWINYISVCAQASPMLGLLGTVIGMVSAFATLQTAGAADPSKLAGDISVALLTTLWGLLNAIPCIIVFYILKNRFANLTAECVHSCEELLNAAIATVNADTLYAKIPEGIAE